MSDDGTCHEAPRDGDPVAGVAMRLVDLLDQPRVRAGGSTCDQSRAPRQGGSALIDVAEIQMHLLYLQRCGVSQRAVAEISAVAEPTVARILTGTQRRVRRDIAGRLISTSPRDTYDRVSDDGFVPRIGAQRRVRALFALGWTDRALTDRTGTPAGSFRAVAGRHDRRWISARWWRLVATTYDELWDQPGPCEPNRRRAARYGWDPPMAWDEEGIDDPLAGPWTTGQEAESDLVVDGVAVDRAVNGTGAGTLNPAELVAAVERLADQALSDQQIAHRVNRTPRHIQRVRAAHGIKSRLEVGTGRVRPRPDGPGSDRMQIHEAQEPA